MKKMRMIKNKKIEGKKLIVIIIEKIIQKEKKKNLEEKNRHRKIIKKEIQKKKRKECLHFGHKICNNILRFIVFEMTFFSYVSIVFCDQIFNYFNL